MCTCVFIRRAELPLDNILDSPLRINAAKINGKIVNGCASFEQKKKEWAGALISPPTKANRETREQQLLDEPAAHHPASQHQKKKNKNKCLLVFARHITLSHSQFLAELSPFIGEPQAHWHGRQHGHAPLTLGTPELGVPAVSPDRAGSVSLWMGPNTPHPSMEAAFRL